MAKPYARLLSDHKADYSRFFNRISLTLGDGTDISLKAASLPTDRRLAARKEITCVNGVAEIPYAHAVRCPAGIHRLLAQAPSGLIKSRRLGPRDIR